MTDEQLEAHLAELRSLSESPQTLRSILSAGRKRATAKKASKLNLDLLGF